MVIVSDATRRLAARLPEPARRDLLVQIKVTPSISTALSAISLR
jgi:hypothetical protein